MFSIPWYIFLLQFVARLFLANGVPHFVQGISGEWFQTPFASPPGVGESSPVINVLWGMLHLAAAFVLLFELAPKGAAWACWSSPPFARGMSDGCARVVRAICKRSVMLAVKRE